MNDPSRWRSLTKIFALGLALAAFVAAVGFRSRANVRAAAVTQLATVDERGRGASGGETARMQHAISERARGERRDWFVRALAKPIEMSGRVFVDGRPFAGAEVALVDTLTTTGVLPRRQAVADREGRFVFSAVVPIGGSYRITASSPGLTPAAFVAAGSASRTEIELRLETCKMHIYGVVTDASGGPVNGARVFVAAVPEYAVATDASGHFAICAGLRATKLQVEAGGYGSWSASIIARGALRQDVTLLPEASIEGSVVSSVDGGAVPFAIVTLTERREPVIDVQADENGHFEVHSIAPANYAVEARADHARTRAPKNVAVFASEKTEVRVDVDPRASVRGHLVSEAGPVAQKRISLGVYATFAWGSPTVTDEEGAFVVDDAPTGSLFVSVEDSEVVSPKTLAVPAAGVDNVTIRVAARADLTVAVTQHGAPVSDAQVTVRGYENTDTKPTDAAGIATFHGLGDASYHVLAQHDNDFAVLDHVDVARASKEGSSVTLDLKAGREVLGRVVDEIGAPVDGARVDFVLASSTEGSMASAVTGSDGTFRGGPLRRPTEASAINVYRPKVVRSGFKLTPKTDFPELRVPSSGAPAPAELVLVVKTQDKELAGTVVDRDGAPLRDARVTVTAARAEPHAGVLQSTSTGNDGSFMIRNLGVGPFSVHAYAPSGSEGEVTPVTLPTGALTISLPAVSGVRGALRGFSDTPSLMAWNVEGYDRVFHTATFEAGGYVVSGLSRGRYNVAAATASESASATVDVDGVTLAVVDLEASKSRAIHGRVLDLVTQAPLANLNCQAAPFVGGGRSPVVVPGNFFSDTSGAFTLPAAPAIDLYMWCNNDGLIRGGAARLPVGLGEQPVTVWGLDLRGKPLFDPKRVGLTFAEDFPFSRRIVAVEPKSAGARGGILVGDVIDRIGEKSVTDCGNGTVRNYLGLVLTEQKNVALVVNRDGATVTTVIAIGTDG